MESESKLVVAKSVASCVNVCTAAFVFESKSAMVASAALGVHGILSVEKTDEPVSALDLILGTVRDVFVGTVTNFIMSGIERQENKLDISTLTSPLWESDDC